MPLGTPHPDDIIAFCAVAAPRIALASSGITPTVEDVVYSPLSASIVAIGSPEAEALTQIAFGYDKNESGGYRYSGDTIDLPYHWLEDPTAISASYRRYSEETQSMQWRPNWPVVSNVGARERTLYPEVDQTGTLISDYLLITRIPNYLSSDGLQLGSVFVSIAGTHGAGTKAIELLVNDRKTLSTLSRRIPLGCDSFQILCRALDLRVDAIGRTRASKIEVLDVQLIDSFDAKWNASARLSSRRLGLAMAAVDRTGP